MDSKLNDMNSRHFRLQGQKRKVKPVQDPLRGAHAFADQHGSRLVGPTGGDTGSTWHLPKRGAE